MPRTPVELAVAATFLTGSVVLFRAARAASVDDLETTTVAHASARAAFAGSFGLIILAEWGDLTQLAEASLAATTRQPVAVGIGALAALATVSMIACTVGRQLVERLPIHKVNYVGSAVFATLAIWTLVEVARG